MDSINASCLQYLWVIWNRLRHIIFFCSSPLPSIFLFYLSSHIERTQRKVCHLQKKYLVKDLMKQQEQNVKELSFIRVNVFWLVATLAELPGAYLAIRELRFRGFQYWYGFVAEKYQRKLRFFKYWKSLKPFLCIFCMDHWVWLSE